MPGGYRMKRGVIPVLISIVGLPVLDSNATLGGQYRVLLEFVFSVLYTEFYT